MWSVIKNICSRSYEALNNLPYDDEMIFSDQKDIESQSMDDINKYVVKRGHTPISFIELVKQQESLSLENIKHFSNLYRLDILDLYKSHIDSEGNPHFTYTQIYPRLINGLNNNVFKHLKLFKLVGLNKQQRPIISIANNCSYRTAHGLVLAYQKEFIQYILPRLSQHQQFILLTIFRCYISIPSSIDYLKLREKYKRKYPKIYHISFYLLLKSTGYYLPEIIYVSNNEYFKYNHMTETRDSILWY